jgi:hypothetical protein
MGAVLGLATGTIGTLYNIASGIMAKHHANVLDSQSVRPVYAAPTEIAQNNDLARRAAQSGMSGTQYNNDLNNINTNESAGLSTLNQGRNGLAGVGNLVAQGNNAALNLDSQDAQMKRQNLQGLINANNTSAEYADKAFQYNQADKYAQQQNLISQYRGQGNAQTQAGINSLANIAATYFTNKSKTQ